MAKLIDSLAFGESSYVLSIPFGTCTTSASNAAKAVTVENWVNTLNEESIGARVCVKFVDPNTISHPTLDVNNTGPLQIRHGGAILHSSQHWNAGAIIEFVYDGTYWNVVGTINDNNDDTKYALRVGASTGNTNAQTEDGFTYIKLIKSSTIQDKFNIKGGGGTKVTSDANGNITITSDVSTTVVNNTTTSKYYLTGSTSSSSTTGNLVKRSAVYVDTWANIVANNIPATGLIWQTF